MRSDVSGSHWVSERTEVESVFEERFSTVPNTHYVSPNSPLLSVQESRTNILRDGGPASALPGALAFTAPTLRGGSLLRSLRSTSGSTVN